MEHEFLDWKWPTPFPHTSLNRSYYGKCIQLIWICYAFGISTFTFLKLGQNDSDLTFFFLRQKFYHDTWIVRGGCSGFGTAWGGMDPTDFNVNWTHPTKIPPITIYGAIVQKCPNGKHSDVDEYLYCRSPSNTPAWTLSFSSWWKIWHSCFEAQPKIWTMDY